MPSSEKSVRNGRLTTRSSIFQQTAVSFPATYNSSLRLTRPKPNENGSHRSEQLEPDDSHTKSQKPKSRERGCSPGYATKTNNPPAWGNSLGFMFTLHRALVQTIVQRTDTIPSSIYALPHGRPTTKPMKEENAPPWIALRSNRAHHRQTPP
jgi:hypothetical protein